MVNQSNTEDDDGVSFYAVDEEKNETVLGPFGSAEYARKCAERMTYPRELTVAKNSDGPLGPGRDGGLA